MEKVERFKLAYEYLRSLGIVHKQKDISEAMNVAASNISHAFKGNPRFLTDKFLIRFNSFYNGIFNEDWLTSGEGSHLSDGSDIKIVEDGKIKIDISNLMGVKIIAQKEHNILIYPNQMTATKAMLNRLHETLPGSDKINGKKKKFKTMQALFDSDPTKALWIATGLENLVVISKNELEAFQGQIKALKLLNDSKDKEIEVLKEKIASKSKLL